MSSWPLTKYETRNWPSYNTALKQRGSLSIWFDPEMVWVPPPNGNRGRQQRFSDAAIQTCLTLKVLFGMPLRQTTGFVESLLRLVGLDWAVPDYSTLCRRQRARNVSLPYRGGTGPLHLLIDSTGIKSECEGEWNTRKPPFAHAMHVLPGSGRPETPHLAQDTQRDRRRNLGNSGGRSHHQQRRPLSADLCHKSPARQWIRPCTQTCLTESHPIRTSGQ